MVKLAPWTVSFNEVSSWDARLLLFAVTSTSCAIYLRVWVCINYLFFIYLFFLSPTPLLFLFHIPELPGAHCFFLRTKVATRVCFSADLRDSHVQNWAPSEKLKASFNYFILVFSFLFLLYIAAFRRLLTSLFLDKSSQSCVFLRTVLLCRRRSS